MTTINEQELFLSRYKEWSVSHNCSDDKRIINFSELLAKFKQFHVNIEHDALINASEFNIFDILWVSTDEVRHSAFLRELLDPQGSHGQGFLFLRTFLEKCAERSTATEIYEQILPTIEEGEWTVWREHLTNFGRMDVLVMNPILGVVIVIENKIYAYEQRNQLTSYGKWMKTIEKDFPLQGLIFVTPSGYQSATAGEFPYITLSYKREIIEWLCYVLPHIQAQVVRSTIEQYLNLISRF